MANLILSEAEKLSEVNRFPGIDRRFSDGAYTCRNFRILPGGALEKREGFYPVTTLPGVPRASWCGNVFGEEKLFCLVDNVIYSVDCEDEGAVELGSVSSVDGRADFFYCRGGLYLVDGEDIYSVSPDGVEKESGYVPIYGRDWNGMAPGEIYEPVNFLSDRIIVHFKLMDVPIYYLELGIKCSEILSCTMNGAEYEGTAELASGGTRIKLSNTPSAESEMCFLLRLDDTSYRRGELQGVTKATQGGGDSDSRVLLFGGEDPSRIFSLRDVDESSIIMSCSMDSDSSELYFPTTDTVLVGDGREDVTAALPYGEKMLVFTATGAWTGDFSGRSKPRITRISSTVGCLAPQGAAVGKYAYTVTSDGIFCWDSVQAHLGTHYAKCISGPISGMLSAGFCRGAVAHYSALYGEVWFADPDSDDYTVFVYNEENGQWYTFDSVPTHRFFTLNGNTAMLFEKYFLTFSRSFRNDVSIGDMDAGGEIEAEYLSHDMDMGIVGRHKKIRRILGKVSPDGADLTISLYGDRAKKPVEIDVTCRGTERGVEYFDRRVNTGRFERMNFGITSSVRGRIRVDSVSFAVFK